MYGKEVMNPGDYTSYENQADQDNKKPFYHLFKTEFFPSFPFNSLLQYCIFLI